MTAEKAERQDAAEAVSEKENEMDVAEVFQFMNRESLAALTTVGDNGRPQFAVTCEREIIFGTVKTCANTRTQRRIRGSRGSLAAQRKWPPSMRAQHGSSRKRNWQGTSRLTLRNLPTGRNGSHGPGLHTSSYARSG